MDPSASRPTAHHLPSGGVTCGGRDEYGPGDSPFFQERSDEVSQLSPVPGGSGLDPGLLAPRPGEHPVHNQGQ